MDRRRSHASTALRWTARLLGVLMGGFFLFMFIGESLGSPGDLARIRALDALHLGLWAVYIVGVVLAVRWERTGFYIALGGLVAFFVLQDIRGGVHAMLNPFLLAMWLPLILYGSCWSLEGGAPHRS